MTIVIITIILANGESPCFQLTPYEKPGIGKKPAERQTEADNDKQWDYIHDCHQKC